MIVTPKRTSIIDVQVKKLPDAYYNAAPHPHPAGPHTKRLKQSEPSPFERYAVDLLYYNNVRGGVATTRIASTFRKREWAERFADDYRKLIRDEYPPTLGERIYAFAYLRLHPLAMRVRVGWAWTKSIVAKRLPRSARTGDVAENRDETR